MPGERIEILVTVQQVMAVFDAAGGDDRIDCLENGDAEPARRGSSVPSVSRLRGPRSLRRSATWGFTGLP